jgi:hypothetical protein
MLRRPSANPVNSGLVAMFFACDGHFSCAANRMSPGNVSPAARPSAGLQYAIDRRPSGLESLGNFDCQPGSEAYFQRSVVSNSEPEYGRFRGLLSSAVS